MAGFRLYVLACVGAGLCLAGQAFAADAPAAGHSPTRARLMTILKAAAADPAVITAVRQQNAKAETLTRYEIYQIDSSWMAEAQEENRPTIDALLQSQASIKLHGYAEPSHTQELVFVTDQRGSLVAATEMTFRYLMDETGLWRQAFLARPGAVLTTPASWHDAAAPEDDRLWMSIGVRDPETRDVIGVVSAEFVDDALEKTISDETSPQAPDEATIETDQPAAPIRH